MSIRLYVEGGGDSTLLRSRCREAFRKLLERAGLERMPRIIACGGRAATFDDFRTAHGQCSAGTRAILLVDSEQPVQGAAWAHLKARDGWSRPDGAANEQAQLMVACMETWIVADRAALRRVFGHRLRTNALPSESDLLEQRGKEEIQGCLEAATAGCALDRRYRKGKRSFQVMAEVDPAALARLPHFTRLLDTLRHWP